MLPHESIITDAEVRKRPSVQLDYTRFQRRDPLTLWKNRLIVGLGLGATALGLWWWFSGWWQGGNSAVFAPGPVASMHAAWETQCTVCHAPNEPAGRGWGAQAFGVSHTPDSKCNACHSTAAEVPYAVHHQSQSGADTPTCAACHLEHQGRAAQLTRVGDRFCAMCHANIENHFQAEIPKQNPHLRNVPNWSDHPEFNVPREDPTHLKFNHKLHLAPGMTSGDGAALMQWGQVDSAFRVRVGAEQADPASAVQLNCAACHQPDEAGAAMKPVVYERHCQACHPLTVKLPNDATAIEMPHRLKPSVLHEFLEGMLVSRALQSKPESLQRPPWMLPGKDDQFKLTIADRLSAVERDVIGSKKLCNECHQFSGQIGKGTLVGLGIEPTNVANYWYKQAKFNHAAHRQAECRTCHAAIEGATTSATMAIPNIDNCRLCHGPTRTEAGALHGGVRFDCVECHNYHDGDYPHADWRGTQRKPTPRDLDAFLKPSP